MGIKILGDDELIKKLREMAEDGEFDEQLEKACDLVIASAIEKAPKETGDLRRSIQKKIEDGEGIVYTNLEYAPYVEYGTGLFAEEGGRTDVPWSYKDDEGVWHSTKGQKPQPFLRPALSENRKKILEILKEGLNND